MLSAVTSTPRSTVHRYLKRSGRRGILPGWIPHALTPSQKRQRVVTCQNNLNRSRTTSWLNTVVAQDEKWCMYDNTTRVLHWLPKHVRPERIPKPPPHGKKIMISFWFTTRGVVHYTLLPDGQTMDADLFVEDMLEMKRKLLEKHPRFGTIRVLMDNAPPHRAKRTKEAMKKESIEVVAHPAYSPDISPCDYAAFRSLAGFLKNKRYSQRQDLQRAVNEWIDSKPASFWEDAINSLPNRWRQIVATHGEYVD